LYTIGTAAELLDVHPRTLRLYEQAGLLRPARRNNRRFYSNNDLNWIRCVRFLIHKKGLNQEGLRRLLAHMPCWEIRGCAPQDVANCPAKFDHSNPCWKLAESYCAKADKCLECEMYLSSKEHLMLAGELTDIPSVEEAEAV
jgi:MerR family transcriptional regulator, heat shock protein HspR